MALLGIESLIYGVDDLPAAIRFYDDFGLEAKAFRIADAAEMEEIDVHGLLCSLLQGTSGKKTAEPRSPAVVSFVHNVRH